MMKNKSKSFWASIIGVVVSGLYIVALFHIISTTWISFKKSGLDDTRIAVEGSLYIALMLVIITTFALSVAILVKIAKNKDIFNGRNRKILFSDIFFLFFVAFLCFVLSVSGVGTLAVILYVLALILLSISATLLLVDFNENLKIQKENRNKIDNTATQDNFYKIEEIMNKNINDKE